MCVRWFRQKHDVISWHFADEELVNMYTQYYLGAMDIEHDGFDEIIYIDQQQLMLPFILEKDD